MQYVEDKYQDYFHHKELTEKSLSVWLKRVGGIDIGIRVSLKMVNWMDNELHRMLTICCKHYNVSVEKALGKCRLENVMNAKKSFIFVARKEGFRARFLQIFLGYKDDHNIGILLRQANSHIKHEMKFREKVEEIEREIQSTS